MTAPPLDPACAYLWNIWVELHQARGYGMAPNPISWLDLDAYARLTDERFLPWEARAVRAVDEAFFASESGSEIDATQEAAP